MAKRKINIAQIDGVTISEDGKAVSYVPTTQVREQTKGSIVSEYAAAMREGARFPPIEVWTEDGKTFYVSDGIHRIKANIVVGYTDIEANVNTGSKQDAIFHALSANSNHGLPLNKEDRKNIILLTLTQPGTYKTGKVETPFAELSDNIIHEITKIHRVGELRNELIAEGRLTAKGKVTKAGLPVKAGRPRKERAETDNELEEETAPAKVVTTDKNGWSIPERLERFFTEDVPIMVESLRMLKDVRNGMKVIFNAKVDVYPELTPITEYRNRFNRDAKTIIDLMEDEVLTDNICHYCKATQEDCRVCNGIGLVNNTTFVKAPEELQKDQKKIATKTWWKQYDKEQKELAEKSETGVSENGQLAEVDLI